MTAESPSIGSPLGRLRPISPSKSKESSSPNTPELSSQHLSRLRGLPLSRRRVLDLDVECVAAGFADPAWVPVRITAYAYGWVGDSRIAVDTLPVADFYDHEARRRFLLPLLAVIEKADVVTGHNIIRSDLPWINGECLELGLPKLDSLMVQDTIRLGKVRHKKGQDVLAATFGIKEEKLPLNWAQWEAAYAEPDLRTVRDRVAGDVRQHMRMREAMIERGWLSPPRRWNP